MPPLAAFFHTLAHFADPAGEVGDRHLVADVHPGRFAAQFAVALYRVAGQFIAAQFDLDEQIGYRLVGSDAGNVESGAVADENPDAGDRAFALRRVDQVANEAERQIEAVAGEGLNAPAARRQLGARLAVAGTLNVDLLADQIYLRGDERLIRGDGFAAAAVDRHGGGAARAKGQGAADVADCKDGLVNLVVFIVGFVFDVGRHPFVIDVALPRDDRRLDVRGGQSLVGQLVTCEQVDRAVGGGRGARP